MKVMHAWNISSMHVLWEHKVCAAGTQDVCVSDVVVATQDLCCGNTKCVCCRCAIFGSRFSAGVANERRGKCEVPVMKGGWICSIDAVGSIFVEVE